MNPRYESDWLMRQKTAIKKTRKEQSRDALSNVVRQMEPHVAKTCNKKLKYVAD